MKLLYTNTSLDNLLGKTYENKSFLEKQRPGTPSNSEENIRKTLIYLNNNDFTDEIGIIDKRFRNIIENRLFPPSTSQRFILN